MTRFLAILTIAVALTPQDTVKLQRTFKVGEVDKYQAKLSLSTEIGDIDIHLKTSQTVKSVSESGEAELEGEILELKTMINGADMPPPANNFDKKTVFRVDRNGIPLGGSASGGFGFNFLNFAGVVGDKPLAIGQKSPINVQDPKDPKRKITGEVLLESLKDGEAKLVSNLEIQMPENSRTLKVAMTSFVEVANGKLRKASGTASGVAAAGTEVKAIQFSIERSK